jgi:hypothetical protein
MWAPRRHLAIDECIQGFTGRSDATVNIPGKPTPTGYKIWVIAEHGYVLNWLYHRKGERYGPVNLDQSWLQKGFSKTEAVLLTLVTRLPTCGKGSIIYLDNLFTSTRLCRALRSLGVGSCGTVRLSTTAREEYDARKSQEEPEEPMQSQPPLSLAPASSLSSLAASQIASQALLAGQAAYEVNSSSPEQIYSAPAQRQAPELEVNIQIASHPPILPTPLVSQPQGLASSQHMQEQGDEQENWPGAKGLHPKLIALKKEHNSSTPWGALYACTSRCGQVLQIAWKDQQLVMMMTTVHRGDEVIKRKRKKPAKGSAGHATAKPVFGEQWTKILPIPSFIDDYNHHMHAVDTADQLRASYNASRRCRRTWKPLFFFQIDQTTTNAFLLSAYMNPAYPQYSRRSSRHGDFQSRLAIALMQRCEQQRAPPPIIQRQKTSLETVVKVTPEENHQYVSGFKNNRCKACLAANRAHTKQRKSRKPLGELTNTSWARNQLNGAPIKKHTIDAPRTTYGCSECRINLCQGRCWEEHIKAIRLKALQNVQASLYEQQLSLEPDDDLCDSFEYSSEAGNDILEGLDPPTSSNTGVEASDLGDSFST